MYRFFDIVGEIGLTDKSVAKRMGVTTQMYSRYKNGQANVTADFIRRAHQALRDGGIRKRGGEEYTIEELFFSGVAVA